eukprot:2077747-Rhodomonas_salina.3
MESFEAGSQSSAVHRLSTRRRLTRLSQHTSSLPQRVPANSTPPRPNATQLTISGTPPPQKIALRDANTTSVSPTLCAPADLFAPQIKSAPVTARQERKVLIRVSWTIVCCEGRNALTWRRAGLASAKDAGARRTQSSSHPEKNGKKGK